MYMHTCMYMIGTARGSFADAKVYNTPAKSYMYMYIRVYKDNEL